MFFLLLFVSFVLAEQCGNLCEFNCDTTLCDDSNDCTLDIAVGGGRGNSYYDYALPSACDHLAKPPGTPCSFQSTSLGRVNGTCLRGECIDLSRDEANCGELASVCIADERCCASQCTNVSSDAENCGECGKACVTDERCEHGKCVTALVRVGEACDPQFNTIKCEIGNCVSVAGFCNNTDVKCTSDEFCALVLNTSDQCVYPNYVCEGSSPADFGPCDRDEDCLTESWTTGSKCRYSALEESVGCRTVSNINGGGSYPEVFAVVLSNTSLQARTLCPEEGAFAPVVVERKGVFEFPIFVSIPEDIPPENIPEGTFLAQRGEFYADFNRALGEVEFEVRLIGEGSPDYAGYVQARVSFGENQSATRDCENLGETNDLSAPINISETECGRFEYFLLVQKLPDFDKVALVPKWFGDGEGWAFPRIANLFSTQRECLNAIKAPLDTSVILLQQRQLV